MKYYILILIICLISQVSCAQEKIEKIEIKQVGFSISHMIYYELTVVNHGVKSTHRIVDRFNLLNSLKNRLPIINTLKGSGLSDKNIKLGEYSLANKLGFRDEIEEN